MINERDKLYYNSNSKDVKPGLGVNEHINNLDDYDELSKIKDWRKILSNFHKEEFTYNGYRWNTIEHAFQASKINLVDQLKGYLFTIDSGNEIGIGDGIIARKNRKLVLLNNEQLNIWNLIKDNILYDITKQKYEQNELSKKVLIATNNAELWHGVRFVKPQRMIYLENIRNELKTI